MAIPRVVRRGVGKTFVELVYNLVQVLCCQCDVYERRRS